jgi:hypothetical protein
MTCRDCRMRARSRLGNNVSYNEKQDAIYFLLACAYDIIDIFAG